MARGEKSRHVRLQSKFESKPQEGEGKKRMSSLDGRSFYETDALFVRKKPDRKFPSPLSPPSLPFQATKTNHAREASPYIIIFLPPLYFFREKIGEMM